LGGLNPPRPAPRPPQRPPRKSGPAPPAPSSPWRPTPPPSKGKNFKPSSQEVHAPFPGPHRSKRPPRPSPRPRSLGPRGPRLARLYWLRGFSPPALGPPFFTEGPSSLARALPLPVPQPFPHTRPNRGPRTFGKPDPPADARGPCWPPPPLTSMLNPVVFPPLGRVPAPAPGFSPKEGPMDGPFQLTSPQQPGSVRREVPPPPGPVFGKKLPARPPPPNSLCPPPRPLRWPGNLPPSHAAPPCFQNFPSRTKPCPRAAVPPPPALPTRETAADNWSPEHPFPVPPPPPGPPLPPEKTHRGGRLWPHPRDSCSLQPGRD